MTISADQMKDAPAWATDVTDTDVSEGPMFTRRLEAHANLATTTEVIDTSGATPYRLGFELTQRGDGAVLLESDEFPASWFMFADPGAARVVAAALLNAADEWEAIQRQEMCREMAVNLARLMAERGVDAAGLADRLKMDAGRVDSILASEVELSITELALFATAFGVEPSRLLPTHRDV